MQVRAGVLVVLCSVGLSVQLLAADKSPKKNIIFDIGKVIFFNRYHTLKNTTPEQRQIFKAIRDSEERRLWFEGYIDSQELIDRLANKFNKHDLKAAVNKVLASREFIPVTVSVIEQLKARGYKLYILSNTSQEVYDKFVVHDSFFKQFDGMLFSFDAHALKPGAQIYKLLLDTYNLNPHESVFIDDKEKNVIAADKLGITGVLFKPDTIIADLEQLGVL